MKILEHFDRTDTATYIIYRLKDAEWDQFLSKLPVEYRACYITDHDLKKLSGLRSLTPSQFLDQYILPDEPTIKSGDFGELLSFFALIENLSNKGMTLTTPLKWQWKESKNTPSHGADGIVLHIANDKKYSINDLVVTIESKMKAVNSTKHRIQDAIDGATMDKLSRMAKTLNWLEEKYAKLGDEKQRIVAERFKDPATHGDFKKQHKAIAILDATLEADELSKAPTNPDNVTVIIFSIKDLKKVYEETRSNIIKSV
jgi:hypothetical protein